MLAPEYEKAAATSNDSKVLFTRVDCISEHELCNRYDIKGYPTLKVFRGLGDISTYVGTKEAIA